jgi:hypothetical protein
LPVEAPALRQRIGLDVVGRLDRGEDLGVPANKLGVVAEDLRAPDVIWEFDAPPLGVPDGLTFSVGSVFHDIEAAGSTGRLRPCPGLSNSELIQPALTGMRSP